MYRLWRSLSSGRINDDDIKISKEEINKIT